MQTLFILPYSQNHGWAIANKFNIGRFKFGDLVRNCHTHIYKYEILVDLNLAIAKLDCQSTKLSGIILCLLVTPPYAFRLSNFVLHNNNIYDMA